MPFTDDELEALYGGLGNSHVDYSQPAISSQPVAEDTPVPFKLGRQIANIIPATANVLTGDINRLAGYIDPQGATPAYQASVANPVPTFNVGQNKGIKDTILNQAVPEIASWMIPYEGELKAAKVLGGVAKFGELPLAARIGTEALAQGSANFISAPNQQDAMQQGAMGAVSGALQQGLPRLARLPFLATASYAGTSGDPLGTVLNTGFNMIPGFHGDIPSVTAPPLVDRGFQDIQNIITPQAQLPASPTRLQLPYSSDPNFTTSDNVIEGQANRVAYDPNARIVNPAPIDPNAPALQYANDPNFMLGSLQDTEVPSGLKVSKEPFKSIQVPQVDVEKSGLNLAGFQPDYTQLEQPGLHPLMDLQAPSLDPNINFKLIDNPELAGVSQDTPRLPLFDWRNEAIKAERPLALPEPPKSSFSSVETPISVIDRIKTAYDKLKTGGFPDVPISDVMKEAGVRNVNEGHAALDELRANGGVNLGGGDASLSDAQTKKWGYQLKGSGDERPYLMMRIEPQTEKWYHSAGSNAQQILEEGKIDRGQVSKGTQFVKPNKKSDLLFSFDKATGPGQKSAEFSNETISSIIPSKLESPNVDILVRNPAGKMISVKEEYLNGVKDRKKLIEIGNQKLEETVIKPIEVMNPQGDLVAPESKMAGPHIISTVLDEGDGQYLSGDKWNSPHAKGEGNITKPHLELGNIIEPGVVNSAFLIKDEAGQIRVTKDRLEAAKIAEAAGQRKPETIGQGPLQSEDLQDVGKPEEKRIEFVNLKSGDKIVVTPSAKKEGKWQATHFRDNNPTGDAIFDTKEDAIQSAQGIPTETTGKKKSKIAVGTEFFKQKKDIEKVQDHEILYGVVEQQLRDNLANAVDQIEKRIAGRKLAEHLEANHPDKLEELQAKAAKLVGNSEGDPRLATERKDSIARWQARYKNQGGFLDIPDEAKVAFLTGGISGLVAYQQSKGDVGTTLAASLVGATLGLASVKAIQRLKAIKGPEVKVTKVGVAGEKVAEKLAQFAKDTSKNAAGLAVGGRGGLFPASMQLARNLLSLSRLPGFDDAKLLADGFIGKQVDRLVEGLKQVRNIQPSTAMSEGVARFIRGQLADPQEVKPILDAGGITGASYNSLDKSGRSLYPDKWMYLDDPKNTNTKGDGVEVWHVTNDVKQKLVQLQHDKLDALAISSADKAYVEFAKTFRDVTDTMMQVYHDALPEGEIKNRMTGTMGQYVVRSHAVITDPSVYPTEVAIQNAMDKLGLQKEKEFFSSVGATEAPSGTNNTAVSWMGNTYYVPPDKALDFQFLHSPESLRGEVRDYIAEIKQIGALQGKAKIETGSENFAGNLFAGRKDLDTIAQALLETHNTPLEMMQATTNKIVRAAQVGHFMQDAVKVLNPESGTASAMSGTEYNKAMQDLKKIIENPTLHDLRIVRDANNKYQELTTYSLTPKNARFGLAEGQYVSQGLKTAIRGFDGTPFGFLDNNIGRGLHWFNGYFKTTHLALSPASISRQIFQAPLMMAMGGVRDAESILNGFRGYKDRSTALGKWMVENGVFASSQAHGDFNSSVEQIINGQFEQGVWGQIKRGVAGAHKLFAAPDDIVRASVFMVEAKRAAAKLGVPLDSFDPRVAEQARNFMLRRAINFANLPLYVKLGREIPFVNIFLAYTHEIARVSKNMAVDASRGDLQAGATLAGMAALPFILQRSFEAQLPTEEKKAWDVAKNLVPGYSRMRFKLPLKKEANGSFSYLDITSVLPFNDYQMMARAVLRGDKEAFADVNPVLGLDKSPFFSVMTPQITGENEHTGRKFRGAGDRAADILGQLLPAWTPGIGFEYQKSAPEALGGQLGVTNLKNGRTNTEIGAFLRNFTGIDFTQLNPDIVTRNAVSAAKEQIANEKQYLYDVLKSTISADAKQRATEKFVESVQHITLDMQSKLQLNGNN